MKNLEKLSFENVEIEYPLSRYITDDLILKVYSDDGEVLAKAKCKKTYIKDSLANYFYEELLEPEINYLFYYVLNEEERNLTDSMPIDEYVQYINSNFGEDEASTLNELYSTYKDLNKLIREYIRKGLLSQYSECIYINMIDSKYDKTGAGTLIVEYLKDNYDLILLYSTDETQMYWENKVDFKEILNGNMYWSKNEKLNRILG